MSTFESAIPVILEHEGSAYVPEDHGRGASRYGITLRTWQASHPGAVDSDIWNLTEAQASEFYRSEFWNRYRIGRIDDQTLATKVLDLAINCGPGTAIKMLQHSAGVPNDGILGEHTESAVNAHNPAALLATLRENAEAHYRHLVEANASLAPCLPGWLARLES
jgi:lysozyme family protein